MTTPNYSLSCKNIRMNESRPGKRGEETSPALSLAAQLEAVRRCREKKPGDIPQRAKCCKYNRIKEL